MTTYTPPPEPGGTASRRNRPVPLVIGRKWCGIDLFRA